MCRKRLKEHEWNKKNIFKALSCQTFDKQQFREGFDAMYTDLGAFEYDESGFTIHYEDFTKRLAWVDITQLNVYKVDQFTIDRIDMEIVYGDKCLTISEELPGWYQFVLKIKEVFPSIPKDWDINIIHPAFATNYTTIYDKTRLDDQSV